MEHRSDDERSSVFIRVHRMAKLFYSAGARVALRATAVTEVLRLTVSYGLLRSDAFQIGK
jgi:hypothetical protein